ncbi:pseudouridine synthase [Olivibacter ginsenosidimutans]|uniref:Pseudouridine synthase n=1 Tax=Olivibacter ginsenosidimutans TaxID=1176537 RepID=A0ABP9BQI3_9SPHI
MPLRNNRNSRDDKSFKQQRPYSENKKSNRATKSDWNSDRAGRSFSNKNAFSKSGTNKKEWNDSQEEQTFADKRKEQKRTYQDKPFNKKFSGDKKTRASFNQASNKKFNRENNISESEERNRPRSYTKFSKPNHPYHKQRGNAFAKDREDDGLIRLNRYIANSGVCSRRKADELILAGVVTVNGVVVTELGSKVDPVKDEVRYNGEKLKREKMIYVLLNKPKDYITTTEDPQERRTVMHLVEKASKERIYPVGRLDRNTTGLLLLTNDGNLAEKLSHPRNHIMKIYHVELSKNLTQGDFNKISYGLELEDGFIKPDDISYIQGASKKEVGIQIHSGKNRIVRRIFESLGYDVVKLDRVIYANLSKKDLPRGRWRYLEEKEIIQLKHFIK